MDALLLSSTALSSFKWTIYSNVSMPVIREILRLPKDSDINTPVIDERYDYYSRYEIYDILRVGAMFPTSIHPFIHVVSSN